MQREQQQQQQSDEIESDDENDRSAMFQANYQYTPLKDYAASSSKRSTSDNHSNQYQSKFDRKLHVCVFLKPDYLKIQGKILYELIRYI